jgi:hypothetical protein
MLVPPISYPRDSFHESLRRVAPSITQKNSQKQVNLLWELYLRYLSPLNRDYSMIVLTTPEPTVRPPSREFSTVFPHVLNAFSGFLYIKTGGFYSYYLYYSEIFTSFQPPVRFTTRAHFP